ncbi:ATP-binding protein [Actinomadura litoris]|uniref:ATP-binding protein n=1 Tax=Actinomadura litoris TaxID=2678616 RepID=UPI001FA6C083|nr:ATP-binding protein [Actinomadura litoris]
MGPAVLMPEIPTLVLESTDRAPGFARAFVSARLREWGISDDYTARLVVSELVANAWMHGDGPIVVRVFQDEQAGAVVIEVWDGGEGRPFVRHADCDDTNGRGLLLVSRLAIAWGIRPLLERGKITWVKCAVSATERSGTS